jgi:hypothetical protein
MSDGIIQLADVVLRFEGDSCLVCHCTKFVLSNHPNQQAAPKVDKAASEVGYLAHTEGRQL